MTRERRIPSGFLLLIAIPLGTLLWFWLGRAAIIGAMVLAGWLALQFPKTISAVETPNMYQKGW